jgi:hypothetical protein
MFMSVAHADVSNTASTNTPVIATAVSEEKMSVWAWTWSGICAIVLGSLIYISVSSPHPPTH